MANSTDVAEFELSKENILPIQQGRKANVLKSALSVQPEDKLFQQRRAYEQQLRLYSGDDPLFVWVSYIKWVEQNYPKGGRDGNICKLIQQCLLNLKDETKYHNDDRFIDTWIKFANLSNKPNEVYTNMYSRNIGCYSSKFYIAWAWEIEQSGDIKRAEEILQEGLRRNAQPVDILKSTYAEVQMRLIKSFGSANEKEVFESDQRSAFTRLKTQAKNKAPISRVGNAVIPTNNQQMVFSQQKASSKLSQARIPFKIYSADNEVSSLPAQNHKGSGLSLHSSGTKENERKPSKWTKIKVQVSHEVSKGPQFIVHCDNLPQPESLKKIPHSTKVLTTHSDPWKPAIALFEEEDPKFRPMYDKAKVYGGGEEFSFEEICAAKWFEKQKQIEKEQKRLQREKEKEDLKKQVKQLQEKMKYLETLPVLQNGMKDDILPTNSRESNIPPPVLDSIYKDHFSTTSYFTPPHVKANAKISEIIDVDSSDTTESKTNQKNFNMNEQGHELNKENNSVKEIIENFKEPLLTKNIELNSNQILLPNVVSPSSVNVNAEIQIADSDKKNTNVHPIFNNPDLPTTVTKRPTIIGSEVNCMLQELFNGSVEHNVDLNDLSLNVSLANNYDFDFNGLNTNNVSLVNNKEGICNLNFPKLDPENKSDQKKNYAIYHDPAEILPSKPVIPFSIFQDDGDEINDENTPAETMRCNFLRLDSVEEEFKIIPKLDVPDDNFEFLSCAKSKDFQDLENIENIPPPDYIQCTEKRELSGILQLSKNVHFVPLEDQLREETDYLNGMSPDDPFDTKLTSELLKIIKVPLNERENFYDYKDIYFEINANSYFTLGNVECFVNNLHAEGAYAKVYSAQYIGNSFIDLERTLFIPMSKLAVKVCEGVNEWEFYICCELKKRLLDMEIIPDISEAVMDIKSAAAYENCLVLISDFYECGTLLDIVNIFKMKNTPVPECLVMYFALEMLHIVSGIHKCGIVHGDVKPDNFVLNEIPCPSEVQSLLGEPICLRLIDFGRAIDLTLFKPGITFSAAVKTDGFQCCQMREGQPWVFESDWYGVLGCIYVLLCSKYMDVRKNADGQWEPVEKFRRYSKTDIWNPLFQTLLNIPSCYEVPNLMPFTTMLAEKLQEQAQDFKKELLKLKLALGKKCSS